MRVGEYQDGRMHGKATSYDTTIENTAWSASKKLTQDKVDSDNAWFRKKIPTFNCY